MNTLVELIENMKRRPAMYIGYNSIFSLNAFFLGLSYGNKDYDFEMLNEFNVWVAKKYNMSDIHGWAKIIYFYSKGDSDALEIFFQNFSEFLEYRISSKIE